MEVQPFTFEAILDALRNQAATDQTPLIVEAHIAISPREARLLELKPARPLKIIRF